MIPRLKDPYVRILKINEYHLTNQDKEEYYQSINVWYLKNYPYIDF
jgi:hypothetical protein